MQSVSSRIWTGVAVSISCDDNHHTTGNLTLLIYVNIIFANISTTTVKLKPIYPLLYNWSERFVFF